MILFTGDYKVQFSEEVTALIEKHIDDIDARKYAVWQLIEAYIDQTGQRPVPSELDRLSSHLLYESLEGDPRPDKITEEDYPILTVAQFNRRYNKEARSEALNTIGTDGVNHRPPTRRKKTLGELIAMDNQSAIANHDRAKRVRESRKPSEVVSYNLSDLARG